MSWDFLIASFIADAIVNRREKKRQQKITDAYSFTAYKRASATPQRVFVRSRNLSVESEYRPLPDECFIDASCVRTIATVKDADFERIRNFYYLLHYSPDNKNCRAELAHYLLHIWYEDENSTVLPLLQNELLYMIESYVPVSIEGRLYQHLAMFLSAQCYFFQGDFVNALKRYYQMLDWQELYENIERDDFITNGLEYVCEAAIANIVNIYALYGLPEKTDEVRKACSAAVTDIKNSHFAILADPKGDSIHAYIRQCLDVLNAKEKLTGFYVLDDGLNTSGNLFKEALSAVIGGKGLFSVQPSLHHPSKLPPADDSICFPWLSSIANVRECISRTREEIIAI